MRCDCGYDRLNPAITTRCFELICPAREVQTDYRLYRRRALSWVKTLVTKIIVAGLILVTKGVALLKSPFSGCFCHEREYSDTLMEAGIRPWCTMLPLETQTLCRHSRQASRRSNHSLGTL